MWLRSVLDPSISWYVNRDEVDWEPSRIAESEGNLWSNLRKIYLFCSYPGIPSPLTTVPKAKLYKKFGDFLSEHTADEAQILLMASEKKLPFRTETALAAFPALLQPDQHEQQRQMQRKLAEYEVRRLQVQKQNLEALTEGEVQANQMLRSKAAAMEEMNRLLADAHRRLESFSLSPASSLRKLGGGGAIS